MTDPGRWLDEHGDAMYRFALVRLGSSDAAEDAVQEALLAALKARESFAGRSSERTWLIGILRHKILDQIRARRRERASGEEIGALLGSPDPAFRADHHWTGRITAPAARGPEELGELRATLLARIAELPPAMREAFCLRELDGLDSAAVCEIMGITPTNLWTLIHRSKTRLREALGQDSGATEA